MSFYMVDFNCFCTICGFVVGVKPADDEEQPWARDWWEAVLFRIPPMHVCDPTGCSLRHNGDGRAIEYIHASFTEGGPNAFYDPTSNEFPKVFHTINDIWQDDRHPWIVVHPKCLQIGTRVVDCRNKTDADVENGPATNLGRLYEIYRSRSEHQANFPWQLPYPPPFVVIWEPHKFFGFGYSLWGQRYDWDEDDPKLLPLGVCPFPLTGITEEILSYLVLLPSQVQNPSQDLPSPAVGEGIAQYAPLENPPLDPERITSPSTWREILFSGRALPWLWDLDPSVLKSVPPGKETAYNTNGVWDWELLVRQLAQVDVFEEGNLMANTQLGLRNRRRIWRLVDVARINDWIPHTRRPSYLP